MWFIVKTVAFKLRNVTRLERENKLMLEITIVDMDFVISIFIVDINRIKTTWVADVIYTGDSEVWTHIFPLPLFILFSMGQNTNLSAYLNCTI